MLNVFRKRFQFDHFDLSLRWAVESEKLMKLATFTCPWLHHFSIKKCIFMNQINNDINVRSIHIISQLQCDNLENPFSHHITRRCTKIVQTEAKIRWWPQIRTPKPMSKFSSSHQMALLVVMWQHEISSGCSGHQWSQHVQHDQTSLKARTLPGRRSDTSKRRRRNRQRPTRRSFLDSGFGVYLISWFPDHLIWEIWMALPRRDPNHGHGCLWCGVKKYLYVV